MPERLEHGLGEVGGERHARSPPRGARPSGLEPGVGVDAPAARAARARRRRGRARRVGEQVADGRARSGRPARRGRACPPRRRPARRRRSSSLVTDASAERAVAGRRGGERVPSAPTTDGRGVADRPVVDARPRTGRRLRQPSQTIAGRAAVGTGRRAEHDVGRVALVDVADQARCRRRSRTSSRSRGAKRAGDVDAGCRAAGSPAGGCSRRSSSWRCRRGARRCGWRRRRARGCRARRARCPRPSRPGSSRSAAPYVGGVVGEVRAGDDAGGAVRLGEVGERPHRVADRRRRAAWGAG